MSGENNFGLVFLLHLPLLHNWLFGALKVNLWLQANLTACSCHRRSSHSPLLPTLSLPFLPPPSEPCPHYFGLPFASFLKSIQLVNSENYPLSGNFLPGQEGELTDSGIWRLLWSAVSRVTVSNKQEHTWNTNVGGSGIYTFLGNDLLDPSTTSCRSEPWVVCCQWKVCDYTKMWKSAKKLL